MNTLGPFGFDDRNEKGIWALQFLAMQEMKITNSFFKHSKYVTHTSYLPPSLPQMLDIFTISESAFKRVQNCQVSNFGILSDHAAIEIHLSIFTIKHSGESRISTGITDWGRIENDVSCRRQFNRRLSDLNTIRGGLTYSQFMKNILRAGADTATEIRTKTIGWFEDGKEALLPAIKL